MHAICMWIIACVTISSYLYSNENYLEHKQLLSKEVNWKNNSPPVDLVWYTTQHERKE